MVQLNKEFVTAWGSLSGVSELDGWRSIPVSQVGGCELMAGRRFPGNSESLLLHFSSVKIPVAEKLPEGRGFIVERVDPYGDGKTWLALTRKESGSVDLFATMVSDVVGAINIESSDEPSAILKVFIGRVRAWQEFMRKGAKALSPEAEIGLIGELLFLNELINAGITKAIVLESWVGPLDGVQDFQIGTGAIEIKTTIASKGFLAKIGSLDQLDDSLRQPLFLAGLRLNQTENGHNLLDIVDITFKNLAGNSEAIRIFSEKLLAVGFFISHAELYSRRFVMSDIRILEVNAEFPRLTMGMVPNGIKRVVYEIDLDKAHGDNLGLSWILKRLGVL